VQVLCLACTHFNCLICRDVIGSDVVIGDTRWAGAWGLRADFIAKTTCSILFVSASDVMVILITVEE
jgi:hypothetical protein